MLGLNDLRQIFQELSLRQGFQISEGSWKLKYGHQVKFWNIFQPPQKAASTQRMVSVSNTQGSKKQLLQYSKQYPTMA